MTTQPGGFSLGKTRLGYENSQESTGCACPIFGQIYSDRRIHLPGDIRCVPSSYLRDRLLGFFFAGGAFLNFALAIGFEEARPTVLLREAGALRARDLRFSEVGFERTSMELASFMGPADDCQPCESRTAIMH